MARALPGQHCRGIRLQSGCAFIGRCNRTWAVDARNRRSPRCRSYDPEDNLHGSARYLLAQLEDFGTADLALAAYNAGPEAVRDYGGIPPYAETEGHVAKVLRLTNATLSSE